ncbi:unnamed protein product [Calicophoron daubneyi]|uniref:Tetraspanin n=1 Tax=Calicophoron daubneyi TaxID=300641 RepID=A0AAV2TNJ5_CALDB
MLCNCACRCGLIIVNSITLIVGIVLLIVGALMVWGKPVIESLLNGLINPLVERLGKGQEALPISDLLSRILSSTNAIGMAVFIIGAIFAILSAIGYCGACCNYKILLYLYAAIIGVIALGLLIFIIVYFAAKSKFAEKAVDLYEQSVKNYTSMKANTVDSLVIGLLQPALHCCGLDNGGTGFANMVPQDEYQGKTYNNLKYPIPCCMMDAQYVITGPGCPATFNSTNSYIEVGCPGPLKDKFLMYMNYVMYGIIGAFIVLLLLILFTILTIKIDVV